LKKYSLEPLGNTILRLIVGGIEGQLLSTLVGRPGGMAGDIAGSAVGGGVLMAIVGLIKNATSGAQTSTR